MSGGTDLASGQTAGTVAPVQPRLESRWERGYTAAWGEVGAWDANDRGQDDHPLGPIADLSWSMLVQSLNADAIPGPVLEWNDAAWGDEAWSSETFGHADPGSENWVSEVAPNKAFANPAPIDAASGSEASGRVASADAAPDRAVAVGRARPRNLTADACVHAGVAMERAQPESVSSQEAEVAQRGNPEGNVPVALAAKRGRDADRPSLPAAPTEDIGSLMEREVMSRPELRVEQRDAGDANLLSGAASVPSPDVSEAELAEPEASYATRPVDQESAVRLTEGSDVLDAAIVSAASESSGKTGLPERRSVSSEAISFDDAPGPPNLVASTTDIAQRRVAGTSTQSEPFAVSMESDLASPVPGSQLRTPQPAEGVGEQIPALAAESVERDDRDNALQPDALALSPRQMRASADAMIAAVAGPAVSPPAVGGSRADGPTGASPSEPHTRMADIADVDDEAFALIQPGLPTIDRSGGEAGENRQQASPVAPASAQTGDFSGEAAAAPDRVESSDADARASDWLVQAKASPRPVAAGGDLSGGTAGTRRTAPRPAMGDDATRQAAVLQQWRARYLPQPTTGDRPGGSTAQARPHSGPGEAAAAVGAASRIVGALSSAFDAASSLPAMTGSLPVVPANVSTTPPPGLDRSGPSAEDRPHRKAEVRSCDIRQTADDVRPQTPGPPYPARGAEATPAPELIRKFPSFEPVAETLPRLIPAAVTPAAYDHASQVVTMPVAADDADAFAVAPHAATLPGTAPSSVVPPMQGEAIVAVAAAQPPAALSALGRRSPIAEPGMEPPQAGETRPSTAAMPEKLNATQRDDTTARPRAAVGLSAVAPDVLDAPERVNASKGAAAQRRGDAPIMLPHVNDAKRPSPVAGVLEPDLSRSAQPGASPAQIATWRGGADLNISPAHHEATKRSADADGSFKARQQHGGGHGMATRVGATAAQTPEDRRTVAKAQDVADRGGAAKRSGLAPLVAPAIAAATTMAAPRAAPLLPASNDAESRTVTPHRRGMTLRQMGAALERAGSVEAHQVPRGIGTVHETVEDESHGSRNGEDSRSPGPAVQMRLAGIAMPLDGPVVAGSPGAASHQDEDSPPPHRPAVRSTIMPRDATRHGPHDGREPRRRDSEAPIRISIGRITVEGPVTSTLSPPFQRPRPSLSLRDYLDRRSRPR